jgi:hypothetical protein
MKSTNFGVLTTTDKTGYQSSVKLLRGAVHTLSATAVLWYHYARREIMTRTIEAVFDGNVS